MTLLLGIDFETTGLNAETDHIIEVGACLWDANLNIPLQMFSLMVAHPGEEVNVTPEIEKITGITKETHEWHSNFIDYVAGFLEQLATSAAFIVAHNAAFEKAFIPQLTKYFTQPQAFNKKPWLCTMTDIPYEAPKGRGTLTHIAADHGFVNPFPHRALPDVLTMFKVLGQYDLGRVIYNSTIPKITLISEFAYDTTGERQKAIKSFGFKWDGITKRWHKIMRQDEALPLMSEVQAAGLPCYEGA